MIYCCKDCQKEIERDSELYSNPYFYDPLWIHLKEEHEELFKLMCDFENPYDIEDCYTEVAPVQRRGRSR